MNVSTFKSISEAVLVAAILSVPGFVQLAEARGGGLGGFHDDGGFGGGSFRGDGGVAVGPDGGAVARGPDGGVAARGPDGGAVAVGPDGGVAARTPLEAYGNYYYGGGGEYYYAGATPGAVANFAVGATVVSLSSAATSVVVADQTYYLDNGIYYQPCYQGTTEVYCVVSPP